MATALSKSDVLRVAGDKIVDGKGKSVLLRGAGLGGWMNQENFITGYPGREFQIRDALDEVLGTEKAKFYWDKFLEYFFTEADAKFFHSLGLNCIRIAINYRHFEDDMNPRVLKPEGFAWLDRVIDLCAKEGIYTIIDLHAAAGGQNTDWHSDNPTHVASFWTHKDFQDRAIWLWEKLAAHYVGNPWIAGYNILNEPTDPTHSRLQLWYDQCIKAIHAIDADHIIFLDGNTFASDFSHFDGELATRWPNCVYAVHDYNLYGFPKSEEVYKGTPEQKARVRRGYERKVAWMKERGLPIWNGEFGPVYARKQYDGEGWETVNESRYQLLKDQLEIYDEEQISWSIWLYKDIGFQGMVHVGLDTPYMKLFKDFHHKKYSLAVDSWGASMAGVKPVYSVLEDFIIQAVPDETHRRLYPYPVWQFQDRVAKISRNILLAEFMVKEWAEHFRGLKEEELDALAGSFKFENCAKRDGLNRVLTEHRGVNGEANPLPESHAKLLWNKTLRTRIAIELTDLYLTGQTKEQGHNSSSSYRNTLMPATNPTGPVAATRYPPAVAQTMPAAASKKKKKKKGKGKVGDGSVPSNHQYRQDNEPADEDEDEVPIESDKHRRAHESEFEGLRMSNAATAQAELLAAANELYKRMETEQLASDSNDGEYWKQLPSHIRSFVETTYAHGAALTPNERSKSQAMLALAQTMVDEATSRFPATSFPPPFDPSLLSDPKFAEKFGVKPGSIGANLMREYADEAYDDYVSDNDDEDLDDEQQYEPDESSKKNKKKKKKKNSGSTGVNGTNTQTHPLPPILPTAPNPGSAVTRAPPSVAQPRPSSRAAGKQPVYSQSAIPPARTNTTRSTATKSPVPPNPYSHGYSKPAVVNGNSPLTKRPTGGGGEPNGKSKLWSNSTEEERERIKEFWLGLSEAERRDLVKLEKEAVLKKMKEQQKHSCSCAVCGRKRNAIEEELEVLYDAYYEELEQYANHQQQYQSSGGKISPPPGPGPFPGSVALDKNGVVIGGPPVGKHPTRGARSAVNGNRGRKAPTDSADEYEDDDYEDDDEDYDDEDEEEEDEEDEDDDDSNERKLAQRRRGPTRGSLSRRTNGREDFFNFGSLTAAGPGNILTVADDLLKNDGGKFLEMMEQLAERRMQRDEEAAKEVEMESDEEDDEGEGSEEEDDEDVDDDDDESEEEEDLMSEEQKMEEGRKMFSIFAARMFEQRVLNAYREKVAAERQEQLLRELADEDKIQAERDAKRQKENQKKKDKKKQQKQAKEAEKAKKDAEKAAEEASQRAKAEAAEEEAKKKKEEERLKRESERKQKEDEKARQAEERRQRIAEQKTAEAERKREKEERERKERLARQEKEALAKAERAEREKRYKEERLAREAKEREDRDRRDKEEKERREKERLDQQKAEEKRKQDALTAVAKAKAGGAPTSPRASIHPAGPSQPTKKPSTGAIKTNGSLPTAQRPIAGSMNRPPQQQPPQSIAPPTQQRPVVPGQSQGGPPMPIGLQLPPNMGLQPIGIPSYNSLGSPIAISPRVGYGPPSASASTAGPFSPIMPFAHAQSSNQPPPGITGVLNGSMGGNMSYPYDVQSPMMSPTPPSTMPSSLSLSSKGPATPTTNGIPPIGISPVAGSSAAQAHIRRASAQANSSPFGAIGKPGFGLARGGSSSVVGEEDRMSLAGPSLFKPSPPSPDRPLGSSALVDENDTIVELPKRRGAVPGVGWVDTIGPPVAVGPRWGRGPQAGWAPGSVIGAPGTPLPLPMSGPGPIGAPWSATTGRPQPGRIGSPYMPS